MKWAVGKIETLAEFIPAGRREGEVGEGDRERLRARGIREAPEPPRNVTLWELSPCSRAGTG